MNARAAAAVFVIVALAAGAFLMTRTIPAPTHRIQQSLSNETFSQ